MKKITLTIIAVLAIGFLSLSPLGFAFTAQAADATPAQPEKLVIPKPAYLPGPSKETQQETEAVRRYFAGGVIARVTQGLIVFAGVSSFIFLIYAGITLLTAYGNEEKITSAKKIATWAIAGLVIAILGFSIVSIVVRLFPAEAPVTQPGETDIPGKPG